jgi:hypothetical protein
MDINVPLPSAGGTDPQLVWDISQQFCISGVYLYLWAVTKPATTAGNTTNGNNTKQRQATAPTATAPTAPTPTAQPDFSASTST